jgi:hypothetical protein
VWKEIKIKAIELIHNKPAYFLVGRLFLFVLILHSMIFNDNMAEINNWRNIDSRF